MADAGRINRARLYSLFCNKHWCNMELYRSSTINKSNYPFFDCVGSCSWHSSKTQPSRIQLGGDDFESRVARLNSEETNSTQNQPDSAESRAESACLDRVDSDFWPSQDHPLFARDLGYSEKKGKERKPNLPLACSRSGTRSRRATAVLSSPEDLC